MDTGQLILWAVIFVLMLGLELSTAQIVSIWFAAGALAALGASFFLPFELQLVIFVLVSVILLICTRPLLKKMKKSIIATNLQSEIGSKAIVIEDLSIKNNTGRVKLNGVDWNARTTDGSSVKTGESVIVREITGTTLVVEKIAMLEDSDTEPDIWSKYNT